MWDDYEWYSDEDTYGVSYEWQSPNYQAGPIPTNYGGDVVGQYNPYIPVNNDPDVIGADYDTPRTNWDGFYDDSTDFWLNRYNQNNNVPTTTSTTNTDIDGGAGFWESLGNALNNAASNVFGNAVNAATSNLNQKIAKKLGTYDANGNPVAPANTGNPVTFSPGMIAGVFAAGIGLYFLLRKKS